MKEIEKYDENCFNDNKEIEVLDLHQDDIQHIYQVSLYLSSREKY